MITDLPQIERLRHLTQNLLSHARTGDWDAAAATEIERRPLLYNVFAEVSVGSHVHYHALLNEILAADREIVQLARQCQQDLGGVLRNLGKGRCALKLYESAGR